MITEYFSLRYIYVSDVVDNKISNGCFIYCYKMQVGIDVSAYTDYLDTNILNSVRIHYPKAEMNSQNIFYDSDWQEWLIKLQNLCVPFYFLPSCGNVEVSFLLSQEYGNITYPGFLISYFSQIMPYKEDPSFPFNKVNFRYDIKFTNEYTTFVRDLAKFIANSVFTFNDACPMMKFNNQYGIKSFDDFYHYFAYKIAINWTELMHETIDVYNEMHLKDFMTNPKSLMNRDVINDSPYMSFCFRKTVNGYENDIIENTDLCQKLQLTDKEKFALIAHELGHFIERKSHRGDGSNKEEIACDEYVVELGLGNALISALRKIVDANICSEDKNDKIKERIEILARP